MGRPPSNGGPSFRFNAVEVGEMEAILLAHDLAVPGREIIDALAQRFSAGAERAGKVEISFKQVLNWFQNRRYALRARAAKTPVAGETNASTVPRDSVVNVHQAHQPHHAPPSVKSVPQVPHLQHAQSVQSAGRNASDTSPLEYEAKSARDGAWYDVTYFLSYRSLGTGDPCLCLTRFLLIQLVENTINSYKPVTNKEALVRFAGFGPEEDEWVNIRKHVRQRSLPCEASECVAVLPGDLALCFQEGKEQALYFDAHVLDAQRRRHDVRGCRCRFLVRYDHDEAEEIVPLRKICRRPETDYRLQLLHAMPMDMNPQNETDGLDPPVRPMPKIDEAAGQKIQSLPKPEEDRVDCGVIPANVPMPLPEIKPEMLLSS